MAAPWSNLSTKLSAPILSAVDEMGFQNMTRVQQECIPLMLKNRDVITEAETGSGKTLAFLIPILETLQKREDPLRSKEVGAIIITPTRELATQIYEVLGKFLSHFPKLSSLLLIGGNSPELDIKRFKENGGNIIVATPGRLQDLLGRPHAVCEMARAVKALDILVLDEADRLLDMGFESSLSTILSYLPKQRRTGLFSATLTDALEDLIRAGLRDPVRVIIRQNQTLSTLPTDRQTQMPSKLQNYYLIVEGDEKLNKLISFLKAHATEKHMLFCTTCAAVDYFATALQKFLSDKTPVLTIHRKKDNRSKILNKFMSQDRGVLVCTDIMGRGIDMPDIDWVIQFDAPTTASNFVHRCGRTARMGRPGCAAIFLLPNEESYVTFIQNTRKVELGELDVPPTTVDYLPKLQKLAQSDRAIYEKGLRAFVSFIQSYSKHECSLIFQLKELDIGKLATGYALLHLPRMPELKKCPAKNFQPLAVDVSAIKFKDKSREKQRQQRLAQNSEAKQRPGNKKNAPWSKKQEKLAKKIDKKTAEDSKETKVAHIKSTSKGGATSSILLGKRQKQSTAASDSDEEDDLARDMRLMKKLKRGKISEKQFDSEFLGSSSDNEDDGDD